MELVGNLELAARLAVSVLVLWRLIGFFAKI